MEHRCGQRYAFDLDVKLHLRSGVVILGRMANASLSGALVRTDVRVPPLSRVVVELESDQSLVSAYVVREAPGEVGLEWTEFSPPAVAALLPVPQTASAFHAPHATEDVPLIQKARKTWRHAGAVLPAKLTHPLDEVLHRKFF